MMFDNRAMEKENKKLREVARKKYIEMVRQLTTYVQRRDPRVTKMESERKMREEEETKRRNQLKYFHLIIFYYYYLFIISFTFTTKLN